jgi:2-amino-4-hydroxy-6-hydroxymethyldihydropteridine diphosphokinase
MPNVYLSLGSNLGDRAGNIAAALRRIGRAGIRIAAVSRLYETAPVGETPEPVPGYLNCAAHAETTLEPLQVLDATQAIERAGGRQPTFRWGPRTIDVDLLLYDSAAVETERLVLPHPRIYERAFVLVPLAEIAPDLVFPDGSALRQHLQNEAVAQQPIRVWGPVGDPQAAGMASPGEGS